jgi:type II secretory pathway pseudopilin PulG
MMARLRGDRGFTIVEVLVSMILMSGGIFAAVGSFGDSLNGAATAQQIDVATATGTQALEEMRSAPYDQVKVQAVAGAPAMTTGDPRERLNGNGSKYQVPGGKNEEVVDPSPTSQFKDVETVTVGGQTMRIYRFVSWRDEECPILNLSDLESTITQLTSLLGVTNGLLNTLVGPGGSLLSAGADGASVVGNPLLGALLAPVSQLVTSVLQPLTTALTPLLSPLQSLATKLGQVIDPVTHHITGVIDLCDIPSGTLPDLGQLQIMSTALTTLNPLLQAVSPLITSVGGALHSLLGLNILNAVVKVLVATPAIVTALPTLLADTPQIVSGLTVTVAGGPTGLATLATSLTGSLTKLLQFLASPDTTHNTKRISVAVWLQDRKVGYGPDKPIWMSTVVSDPSEGLL